MPLTTLSSRDFNQDTARAKKVAANGPVIITDRGTPAHVLMTYERYVELTTGRQSIVDMLALPADVGGDFEPAPASFGFRPAAFD